MNTRIHPAVATILVLALAALTAVPAVAAEAWAVDRAHSDVSFTVHHFFTPVRGSFDDFDITLQFDPNDPAASKVTARIPVASVDTGNTKRDDHLRSPDWFEVDAHPVMTFESSSVRAAGDHRLVADGTLTIKGVSRRISLPIEILGVQDIPEVMQGMVGAKQVASFRATTSVDRNDFGVGVGNWAATTVVGDTVDIELLIEAQRK